jgi:hypothetical protein
VGEWGSGGEGETQSTTLHDLPIIGRLTFSLSPFLPFSLSPLLPFSLSPPLPLSPSPLC